MHLNRRHFFATAAACALGSRLAEGKGEFADTAEGFAISRTDQEWRKRLSADEYLILRQSGTEYPYTSPLLNEKRRGTFACAGCAQEVFSSDTKYDSQTGWPSFWAPLNPDAVGTKSDHAFGMVRTEVHCSRCGGHLGHIFEDGPLPSGLRYCINGVALSFQASA